MLDCSDCRTHTPLSMHSDSPSAQSHVYLAKDARTLTDTSQLACRPVSRALRGSARFRREPPPIPPAYVFSPAQGHLYLLVTDQGFLQEEQVVWESLHNVDGDSCFCDSDFHLSHSPGKGPGPGGGSGSPEKQRQVDQVCGALGARVGCRAHVCLGELCAQGGPPVSYHLETVTYDTRAPLWSL